MGLEKSFREQTYTRTVINPTKRKIRLRVWLNSHSKVFKHIYIVELVERDLH